MHKCDFLAKFLDIDSALVALNANEKKEEGS